MKFYILEKKEKCPVCLKEFENGNCAKLMPCKHCFHKECIEPWLEKVSASC